MSREEAIRQLRELPRDSNSADPHLHADRILCAFLEALGYGDVVREYEAVEPKWYE